MVLRKLSISERSRKGFCRPHLEKKRIILIALIFILCACIGIYFIWRHVGKSNYLVPPNPQTTPPPSPSILRSFDKAAVCTDAPACSVIGKNILLRNGSAVDAAIAALFCNGLHNMHSMGLGGGFLMTIYIHETREAITLNARETAPLKSSPNMFEKDPQSSRVGALAVGVPGELRGYWLAHKRFGKLPWKTLIEPSIELCENGYNMSMPLHRSIKPDMINDPILNELFFIPGTKQFKKAGSFIKPSKLCHTLQTIADNGGDDLYNGTLAKMLADDIQEMGGIINEEDLKSYRAKWSMPIEITLSQNDTLYSVPPPGSGLILVFIINILRGFNFTSDSISSTNNTILTYHRISEAFKFAFGRRTELGDLEYLNNGHELLDNLTSIEYADNIRNQINDSTTYDEPEHYGAHFFNSPDHGTAHISVLAPNGDAVSVTSTINTHFGAHITSQRTGIVLNSGMDDFSSIGFTNFFGLPGSPANAIVPGKRPLSSMCPSIVVDNNGDVKVVIGAAGGTKIITAVAQVLIRMLWFNESVKEAVDAPRLHHQIYPNKLSYEFGVLQSVVDGLEQLGHKTQREPATPSVVCAIIRKMSKIFANADYRKGGDVFGI